VIGVVDYGAGNLGSVMNALERLGIEARFAKGPEELSLASGGASRQGRGLGGTGVSTKSGSPFDSIIFPGDGHFSTAMEALNRTGYSQAIREWVAADRPFFGICIGLQLLFESSEEAPGVPGLGILPGTVRRFPGRKVPQIGWNQAEARPGSTLFAGLPPNPFFYFIHSFYAAPKLDSDVAADTDYDLRYCSAVERGALAAVQFHPEKSGQVGLDLIKSRLGGKHAR